MVYSTGSTPINYASDSIHGCAETYPAQQEHYQKIVQNCLNAGVKPTASVLDVGCALGGLMREFLVNRFEKVIGITVSEEEMRSCHARQLMVWKRDVTQNPDEQFDLVTCTHVLEHVPDVAGFLRGLLRWVKPGGKVYIEVPDATAYTEHLLGICQGFNDEHINHFSHNHLGEALLRNGFHLRDYCHYTSGEGWPCVAVIAEPRWFNPNLRTAIEKYRDNLIPQMERLITRLTRELSEAPEVALWGLSKTIEILLASGAISSERINLATDTNPIARNRFKGRFPLCAPEDFRPLESIPIIVCAEVSKDAIIAKIHSMGLTNKLITLETV